MGNVHDIKNIYKRRIDNTSHCAGCSKSIVEGEEYTEVVLPSADNEQEVTHIALCSGCYQEAEKEGVF